MAGDVINLNKARKARDKAAGQADAASNRARFGRTRGQAAAEKADKAKQSRTLDDAKRDT